MDQVPTVRVGDVRVVVLNRRATARQVTRPSTSHIAAYRVCRSRKRVIGLRFDECMVYQSGRALEGVSLRMITGECPSVHRAEEVPALWISDCGHCHED